MLIFVSGGVRSGKSTFAEHIAVRLADCNGRLHYVATSERYDTEMDKRIEKHRQDRARSGLLWRTWEQSTNLHNIVGQFTAVDVVLIDCLTTLLGNELFHDNRWQDERHLKSLFQQLMSTIGAYKQKTKATIIVSNEIFHNGVPKDSGSFVYMKMLGNIHQAITGIADQAYLVECGIPHLMKEGF